MTSRYRRTGGLVSGLRLTRRLLYTIYTDAVGFLPDIARGPTSFSSNRMTEFRFPCGQRGLPALVLLLCCTTSQAQTPRIDFAHDIVPIIKSQRGMPHQRQNQGLAVSIRVNPF